MMTDDDDAQVTQWLRSIGTNPKSPAFGAIAHRWDCIAWRVGPDAWIMGVDSVRPDGDRYTLAGAVKFVRQERQSQAAGKAYWSGHEDGFANRDCRDRDGFSAAESASYRRGFRDGSKSRAEAAAEGIVA